MRTYSYQFFKNDLNKEQLAQYVDNSVDSGCNRNSVLEYGSGLLGQECFEKQ
jgi:hypothetical protein